jgi:hypothetical protein
MSDQQPLSIQLAFIDADQSRPDPAAVGAAAQQAAADLRGQGYTVLPAYSGAKGGDMFSIAIQLGQNIVDNKDLLIALIGLATPILGFLLNRYERQLDKKDTSGMGQQHAPTFTLTINQATAAVEAADLTDNERLLNKLL